MADITTRKCAFPVAQFDAKGPLSPLKKAEKWFILACLTAT
jgi:hypothetical protein